MATQAFAIVSKFGIHKVCTSELDANKERDALNDKLEDDSHGKYRIVPCEVTLTPRLKD